jgi:hypothetical protein
MILVEASTIPAEVQETRRARVTKNRRGLNGIYFRFWSFFEDMKPRNFFHCLDEWYPKHRDLFEPRPFGSFPSLPQMQSRTPLVPAPLAARPVPAADPAQVIILEDNLLVDPNDTGHSQVRNMLL